MGKRGDKEELMYVVINELHQALAELVNSDPIYKLPVA